jgi:hypothetical protein
MENSCTSIADELRHMFAMVPRQPLGWALIDAFACVQEREEERGAERLPSSQPIATTGSSRKRTT